jgi:hypothetical protein
VVTPQWSRDSQPLSGGSDRVLAGPNGVKRASTPSVSSAGGLDLVRQLLPISPLRGELGKGDLAVLTRTGGHPGLLVEMGSGALTELVREASVGHLGAERAQQWLDAARGALVLYGDHPAFAADALADELQTEIRLRVVGAHLAERALAVMQRGEPYVVRDTDGHPVDRAEARALILERWTAPEEVRRRRRTRKARKAPQKVLMGHVETRRPSSRHMVAPSVPT